MKVCIGGTFNIFHKGHKKLIDKAFQIAGKKGSVFIGLTTGKILNKKPYVKTFEERKEFLLKKAKVALDNGPMFGAGGEGYERVNVACPKTILEECMNWIHKAIKEEVKK